MGIGDVDQINVSSVNDFTATTSYRAPEWLIRLARDLDQPIVNQERHREEKGLRYGCHSAFWQPPEELWKEEYISTWYPEDVFEFDVRTERRKEYIVSAAIMPHDFPTHHNFAQAMIWLSCLNGQAKVFTTHPLVGDDHRGRSVYWAGTEVALRCYLQDGVLAAVYHSTPQTHPKAADFTHAHFPTDEFDHWQQEDRWYFGQLDDAYVGLLTPEGAALAQEGEWAGRDLKAPGARWHGWRFMAAERRMAISMPSCAAARTSSTRSIRPALRCISKQAM